MTVTTPAWPDAPTNLTANAVSHTEIDLAWAAVSGASGYTVEQDPDNLWGPPTTVTTNSYHATGLAPGETYSFRVAAIDGTASPALASGYAETDDVQTSNDAPTIPNDQAHLPAAGASTVTGTSTTLGVLGADDGGEANLIYTWSVVSLLDADNPTAPGEANPEDFAYFTVSGDDNGSNAAKNATVTFTKAGDYTLRVTITDAYGLETTGDVEVTVAQTLTSIAVSPAVDAIESGDSVQLAATALDQFGDAMITQPTFTWSIEHPQVVTSWPGEYSISTSGLFTGDAGFPYSGDSLAPIYAMAGGMFGEGDLSIIGEAECPGSDCPCEVPNQTISVALASGGSWSLVSSSLAVTDSDWLDSSAYGLGYCIAQAISGSVTFHYDPGGMNDLTWNFPHDQPGDFNGTGTQTITYDEATSTWTKKVNLPSGYPTGYFDLAITDGDLVAATLADDAHPSLTAEAVDSAMSQLYAVPDDNGNVLLDITPAVSPLPSTLTTAPQISWTATAGTTTIASGTVPADATTTVTIPCGSHTSFQVTLCRPEPRERRLPADDNDERHSRGQLPSASIRRRAEARRAAPRPREERHPGGVRAAE